MTSVLIVDDHPLFIDGVRAAFAGQADLEVVGEAHDVAEALAFVGATPPDVVLMDLNLPDGSGIDATRAVLAASPSTRVLVITMSAEDDAVVAAMRTGARGFVVKGAGREDLLHAVRTVAAGGAVFSPSVADRLGGFFSGMAAQPGREIFPQLSEREREVLELVARGYDNRRIARELFLSDKTVRNHVSNVLTKLDAPDRASAVERARRAGWAASTDGQPDAYEVLRVAAHSRTRSIRARSWVALATAAAGPPHSRRSSAWVTPWACPVRWCQAPTRPLSSRRSAASCSWVVSSAHGVGFAAFAGQ